MKKLLPILLLFSAATLFAQATTNNDDSCDIALQPAATLLLPYFEVSPNAGGDTALFSVQNVGPDPQIARVTLWTDFGYPALTFNLFIGGYGVMPISLYDVLVRGVIAPDARANPNVINGTIGSQPAPVNRDIDASACSTGPQTIPQSLLESVRNVLLEGRDPQTCGGFAIGQQHANMIGWATIDVVSNCAARGPLDPQYFTNDILFANVLTGDYEQTSGGRFTGNSLVHVRAIPENAAHTSLPYTFYDRLTNGLPSRTIDRREPLPSTFVARWLDAPSAGMTSEYRIWREPFVGNDARCSDYAAPGLMAFDDAARFDEHENASVFGGPILQPQPRPLIASTQRVSITSSVFPLHTVTQPDAGGWLYLNLGRQSWVVTTLIANGYTVSNDATQLGNGCSKSPAPTSSAPIAPLPNVNGPTASAPTTINNDDSCDIAPQPAATLLLPYFEVAPDGSSTTLFSVQNVGANPQIARATIWSDLGYPILTFNLFLPGYASLPISLTDVLLHGAIAPDARWNPNVVNPTLGTQPSPSNPALDMTACATGSQTIPQSTLQSVDNILTLGRDANACANAILGARHTNLIGWMTIDVVANCDTRGPLDPAYFTHDLRFENILTGDYQQLLQGRFTGNALVPIRAVPEDSPATTLPYTFYDRLTKGLPSRTIDRRQPLPTAFAPRWLQGNGLSSSFRIWREPVTGNDALCSDYASNLMRLGEVVRFDEHQNATFLGASVIPEPLPPPTLPVTSRISIGSAFLPPPTPSTFDAGGWLYFNNTNGFAPHRQAWIVTTLMANGDTVSNDAMAMGNGCSKAPLLSVIAPIAPTP